MAVMSTQVKRNVYARGVENTRFYRQILRIVPHQIVCFGEIEKVKKGVLRSFKPSATKLRRPGV